MEAVFAGYSAQELNEFTGFSLRKYYITNHNGKGLTHCLLCKINIRESKVPEHTGSTSHDYNRLFHYFVKKRNLDGDMDFIFVDAKWVECRYCNGVRFNKSFHRIQVEHKQSAMHLERKGYCLNRIGSGPNKFAIPHNSKSTSKPCVRTVAKPSREIKLVIELQGVRNSERNSYRLKATTGNNKKVNIPQLSPNARNPSRKSVSRPAETHQPTVSKMHQLRVGESITLEERKKIVYHRYQDVSVAEPKRKFFGCMSRKRNSKSGNQKESKLKLKKICTIC